MIVQIKKRHYKSLKKNRFETRIGFYENSTTGKNNFTELTKIANEADMSVTEYINELIESLTDRIYKKGSL